MKNIKKTFAVIGAALILATATLPAFAENITEVSESESISEDLQEKVSKLDTFLNTTPEITVEAETFEDDTSTETNIVIVETSEVTLPEI